MSEELNCPFLYDVWCTVFDEPCIAINGDRCNEYAQMKNLYERIKKRIELEAENKRLRKTLEDIAEFADEQYSKRIPAPSCVEFMTIRRYAEKALKGAGRC